MCLGGLSWQTTEATLRSHFEKYGELDDVALMVDKRTGQPRYLNEFTQACVLSVHFNTCITINAEASVLSR